MPHAYSEDELVEQPAIQLFSALGWETISALEEILGPAGTLGRETRAEVVLEPRLRAALGRLNPDLPPEAITLAVDELARDRSAMSLAAANRDVWTLLREGVKVSVPDREHGGQRTERVRVVDWDNPRANDFLLVSQFSVTGALYTRRPDLVGFVNGLPLVVVELKKPGVPARAAFDDNLTSYKADIPQLFWSNALLIVSNGTDSRVGSLTAGWDHFGEWKRVEREDEPAAVSLEKAIRGTCDPARLLDLAENFTVFSEHKSGLTKILAKNHQYLGINSSLAALHEVRGRHGRLGVFWHTQGSGKSFAMVFFAQKVLRKVSGNWTFVVVTDRAELDDQIYRTFQACGAASERCQAESAAHLRELLGENHRYVFTLIHKFRTTEQASDRRDVIVLTDEAHRSQYDTLALNMRSALPNALFLAFTGTPLMAGEERTREVFGDYVSIYDFQQSVEDGATVPLYYENRTPELHLENPDLNDEIYAVIEAAELDPAQEERLERELSRQYHLITRDDRLETIARDIVQHFLGRGFRGKAMVVSIDKATALRMHDKVRKHWAEERTRVEAEIERLNRLPRQRSYEELEELATLERRLDTLRSTDMALIVSPGQNEIEQMRKLGLDIAPHRKRMNDDPLDEKFKDPEDPLRLVFLCAMWLTGFDAPNCSTVYLDKPARNHTLMQTIARANRVFPGKHNGLIVDYANVFASLEKALAIYGKGRGGATPVRDKQKLVEDLRRAVETAVALCGQHGVDIIAITQRPAVALERLTAIAEAVNRLIAPDAIRKDFLAVARLASVLHDAVKPDPAVLEFSSRVSCLATIAGVIRERTGEGGPADISAVMTDINRLLDDSIAARGFEIRERPATGDDASGRAGVIDLSRLDFEVLARHFRAARHRNVELESLKAAIRAQLDRLIRLNRSRTDYLARFEELIESYNAGSRNIEELFEGLLALSRSLTEEQQRHVRERLSEEELTIFDILVRPSPDLSPDERDEVKKVARTLLQRLRVLLVLNWREKAQARAQVRLAIEEELDRGLPRAYTPDLYSRKCSVVFEHVYESYFGEGASVYSRAV
ncbi:MAG: type I restriction endonuclease subunit R [Candidatus Eisenbacteria bacterium]|nr:type I restriction endonuclease subunit R [Candidatus Eisenbacteria bacterium]